MSTCYDDIHSLTSVCLSVAYIGPKSRTERHLVYWKPIYQ